MENKIKQCLIYCRVSTPDQVSNGGGIDSQEVICRNYAKRQGWEVINVFRDLGISGKDIENRPQINEMLDCLTKAKEPFVVLFYDISRLTRENCDFGLLRRIIEQKGHTLSTINGILEQTPIGRFMANIEAAQAQFFRESNAERNENFSQECLKAGWWIYGIPAGYKLAKLPNSPRKSVVPKMPEADIVKQALEDFALGRLVSQSDVLDFINANWKNIGKPQTDLNFVKRILTKQFYTGYFAFPKKDIPAQRWHIIPLIDTETYNLIQDRLAGRNRVKHRKYNMHDEHFPLKGFVVCPACGRPLTASLTKSGTYPYYQCQNIKCAGRKLANVSPKVMHTDFAALLKQIAPAAPFVAWTRTLARSIYAEHHSAFYADRDAKQCRMAAIEQEKDSVFQSFLKSTCDSMRTMCEKKMSDLDCEKAALADYFAADTKEIMPFDQAFGFVADFISCPQTAWQSGDYGNKQLVLDLCFSDRISYNKEQKFRTPVLSPIFTLFRDISGNDSQMVPAARIGLASGPYQGPVLPLYYAGSRDIINFKTDKIKLIFDNRPHR